MMSPTSIASFRIAKQSTVEAAVRRLYVNLPVRNRLTGDAASRPQMPRPYQADPEYSRAASELSDLILGPVSPQLGNKRLAIVSDGALQYVPFSALPVRRRASERVPLVVEHEIVNLPSASVLGMLRQEKQGRTSADRLLAILADPVFSARDPRLGEPNRVNKDAVRGNAGQSLWSIDPQLERVMRSVRGTDASNGLPRLWFSRQEADDIFNLIPPGKAKEYLGFDATLGTATSSELAHYRIVHFATHGILDAQYPELSGLVLSLVDRSGRPQKGFLSLEQIYNLDLTRAQMVVLSACDTALGKEIKGEGLMGLTRGFMYAGATRVVSSLWEVNDVATAELMKRFYRGMLDKGLPPSAALRDAQLEMYRQQRWSSPYYWAGFVITGDWDRLN
jgi:CHAT domain-containing protein